jgi:hypothetical protein
VTAIVQTEKNHPPRKMAILWQPDITFVLKVDDDAFVNFFKYFEEMSHIKEKKKYILCNRINKGTMRIIRVNGSKWYVNEDEFRNMKAKINKGVIIYFKNNFSIHTMLRNPLVTHYSFVS